MLQRLVILLGFIFIIGLSQVPVVCGSDFENQGARAVYRLFFVTNGYVYTTSDGDDVRERATQVALRFGLSQCRAYLEKHGLVSSAYRFESLGVDHPVKILFSEAIDASFQGEGLKAVRIVGEVQYEFSMASQSLPDILQVDIASDQKRYRAGEHLYFAVRANMKAYGSLIDLNPVGELIQLLPNGSRPQSTFDAKVPYLVPDRKSGDDFDLVVGPPFGTEHVQIVASDRPIPPILDKAVYGASFGVIWRDLAWVDQQLTARIVRQLRDKVPQETFYCMQVYVNGITLTTSQSGYDQ